MGENKNGNFFPEVSDEAIERAHRKVREAKEALKKAQKSYNDAIKDPYIGPQERNRRLMELREAKKKLKEACERLEDIKKKPLAKGPMTLKPEKK